MLLHFKNTYCKMKCLPGFFTLSAQLKSKRKIIPKYIQMFASGNTLSRKEKFSSYVTRAFMKQSAMLLTGLITMAFSTAQSPSLLRSLCISSASLLRIISLYIIQSPAKSRIFDPAFLQISFTYERNSSGPSSLSILLTLP
jgi:hypothetical protein